MAGSVKLLKDSEVLFKMGDPADCMYILRRGKLKVYFLKGSEEVTLAHLEDGAIVGEMAFFDNKPRSACVKAVLPTEVTIITRADFDKLLMQVPKWMVTMMQSLVTRLRQTNEKLQILEASTKSNTKEGHQSSDPTPSAGQLMLSHQRHPYQHVLRTLKLLIMSLAKDGQKEGTQFVLSSEIAEKLFLDLIGEDLSMFKKIVQSFEKLKYIQIKTDAYKKSVLAFTNRGHLVNFMEFLDVMSQKISPLQPKISSDLIDFFQECVESAAGTGYEQMSVGLSQLKLNSKTPKEKKELWPSFLLELQKMIDLKVSKSSQDMQMKIIVKEHKLVLGHLKSISLLGESGLC